MRERGRVVTVRDGAVDVRMEVSTECGGCTACSRSADGETIMQEVVDHLGATVGDTVEVVISDSVAGPAAIAVFVVPVASMLAGYLAGFLLGRWAGFAPDIAGLVLGLVAANLAFIGVRLAERRISSDEQFRPKVSAIIARGHGRS